MSWQILVGDMRDRLAELPAGSIDACVTDPPYELGFMGKHWDRSGVSYRVDTWQAVARVLKPGGYLVAFGGTRTSHRMVCAIEDAGFEIRDALVWLYGQGFPKSLNLGDGKGTALKPAHEPIVLARKPFTGTVAANVLAHGTGALNIDACRIGISSGGKKSEGGRTTNWQYARGDGTIYGKGAGGGGNNNALGRWPANVLLDEEAAAMLDEQTGEWRTAPQGNGGNWTSPRCEIGPTGLKQYVASANYQDNGGASRFFYVAKPSRAERDSGPNRNIHSTVKPVDLMRWLVRLTSPSGGLVLDPFMGSGTTGMACIEEGWNFLGVEKEPDYVALARQRIGNMAPLLATEVARSETWMPLPDPPVQP